MSNSVGSALKALISAFVFATFAVGAAQAQGVLVPVKGSVGAPVILDPTDGISAANGQSLIPSWSWDARPGTSVADFSDPTVLRPTFTPDVSGAWVARLELFDDPAATVPVSSLLLNISTGNLPPVALIQARGVPNGGTTLTLDGSPSFDVDGDVLTYAWSLQSAPAGHGATFSTSTGPNVDFTFDTVGTYQIGLTVQDGAGLTSQVATFDIDVSGPSGLDVEATLETFNLVTRAFSGQQEVQGRTFIGSTIQNVTGQFGFMPAQDGQPFDELYIDGDLINSTINLTPGDIASISGVSNNSNVNNGSLVENATNLPSFDFQFFRDQSAFLAGLTGAPADLSDQNNKKFGGAPNATSGEAVFGPNTRIVTATMQDLQSGGYSIDLTQSETVIINVSGQSGAFQMNPLGGTGFAENVIWNFYEATSINVNAVIVGHVLAPYARMTGFAGSSEGTVIADDVLLTNGELHQRAWLGQVPAPIGGYQLKRSVAPDASARFDQLSAQVGASVVIEPFASSDIDGGPLAASVWIISAPSGAAPTLTVDGNAFATFTGDVAGDYLVGYEVSDGARLSTDQVLISVAAGNLRPVSRIADLQTAAVGSASQLDGTQSYDLDGDLLSYDWSLLSAPAGSTAALTNADMPFASITPDVAGLYVVQLAVNDGTASSVPTTLPLVVGAPLPVASAGRDALPDALGQATLDGGLSSGGALTYAWSTLGLTGAGGALDDTALIAPLLSLPSLTSDLRDAVKTQAVYEINRSDLGGLCAFDTRVPADIANPAASGWHGISFWASGKVTVSGLDRPVWVINNQRDFTRDITLEATDGSNLGTVSVPGRTKAYVSTGPLASGAQLRALLNGSQVGQAGPQNWTFNRTDTVCSGSGTEVAQLIVADAGGISLPDTVFVGNTNLRPALSRAALIQINGGGTANLSATAVGFDANGDTLSHSWSLLYRPTGSIATIDPDPAVTKVTGDTLAFSPDRPGLYLIQLEANDGALDAEPAIFLVEVLNDPPVASALTPADTFVGDVATLDGSASSDPNGDAITYNWTIVSAPAGSAAAIPDPFAPIATFTPDVRGIYTFQLELADFEFSDTVQISLTVPNRAPVAVLTGPTDVGPGADTIYDASGSSDPDGDPLTFTFAITSAPNGSATTPADLGGGQVGFVADVPGDYVLEVTVSDGTDSSAQTISISAGALNQAPILGAIRPLYTVELGLELALDLTGSDPDGDAISFFAAPLPLPSGITLDAANGEVRFRPEQGQVGSYSFTVGVSDGTLTDQAVLNIDVVPGTASDTSVYGRVLDAVDFANGVNTPLSNMPVRLRDAALMATTDANGDFNFGSLTAGADQVFIEPSANGGPGGYIGVARPITITQSQNRDLSPDFLLTPLNDSCTTVVAGVETVLTGAASGVTVRIPADTILDSAGAPYAGDVCLGALPQLFDQPGLPNGTQACNIYAIDAQGATFSQGVTLTAPNVDTLPEGTRLRLLQQGGATGLFAGAASANVDVGGATVSALATTVRSGTLFTFLPQTPSSVASSDQPTGKSTLSVFEGDLNEVYTLPGYRAFNQVQDIGLSYHSQAANPTIVVAGDVTIASDASLPVTLSATLDVGGLSISDSNQWTPRQGLNGSTPALVGEEVILRQSLPLDASGLGSGRYRYTYSSQAQYACSTVSSRHDAELFVQNESQSPYGKGWSIDGLQKLDIAPDGTVSIIDDDTVVTFDPKPTFTEFDDNPLVFPARGPQAIVVEDFDSDGDKDVAVADSGTGSILFLTNYGNRNIVESSRFPVVEPSPVPDTGDYFPSLLALEAVDFSNDGAGDLVFASQGLSLDGTPGEFGSLLGDGFGNFTRDTISGNNFVRDIAIADLDGDGYLDIVHGWVRGFFLVEGQIWAYYGGPNGFTHRIIGGTFDYWTIGRVDVLQIEIVDLDNDGDLDVVGRSTQGTNFAFNNGNREFEHRKRALGVWSDYAVGDLMQVGDLNGDDLPDIALSGLIVLATNLNLDGRDFGPYEALPYPAGTNADGNILLFDVNRDGHLDLLYSSEVGTPLSIYNGIGDGTFEPPIPAQLNHPVGDAQIADVDGDGFLDLISNQRFSVTIDFGKASNSGEFVAAEGEFSTLNRLADGSWERRYKDGSIVAFDASGLQTAEIDPQGNRTEFAYDANGRLISKTDQAGGVTTFSYEPVHDRLSTITYPDGRVTTFNYDDVAGTLDWIVEPTGSQVDFAYDANGRLINTTNQNGNTTSYTYDAAGKMSGASLPDGSSISNQVAASLGLVDGLGGPAAQPLVYVEPADRVTTVTDRKGEVTTVEVNQFGSVVKVTDPLGRTTEMIRDDRNLVREVRRPSAATAGGTRVDMVDYDSRANVTSFTEAFGSPEERTTLYEYEPTFNKVTKMTDPDGFDMLYEYDAFGEVTKITDGELGERLFSYTPEGQLLSRTDENGNQTDFTYNADLNLDTITYADGSVTGMTYDASGNAATIAEAQGTPIERQIQRTYDALNRVLTVEVTAADGAQIDGITAYSYQPNGNLATVTDETGLVTTMGYDALERLTSVDDPAEGLIQRTYNTAGEVTQHINGDGEIHTYVYDAVSRLTQTTDPESYVKSFAYDVRDNIQTVTDGRSGLTQFGYDPLDRMTTRTNPINQTMTRAYDGRDNLTTLTREDGAVETATYDGLARRTQVVTPDNTLTYAYDARSNLTEAADNDSRVTFTYDLRNRLATTTTDGTVGPQPQVTLTYAYDELDRRLSMSDSLGGTTQYQWDPENRLTDLTAPWGTVYGFGYDGEGRRTSLTSTSGRNSTYAYSDGLMTALSHVQFGVALTDLNYAYDVDGQLTAIVDNLDPTKSKAISYDQLNRLVQVAEGVPVAQGGTPIPVEDYAYDEEGNRTASHLSALYTSNAQNQLLDDDDYTYGYDLKGNRTSRTSKATGEVETYIYDTFNRLAGYASATTTASYAYDALDRRIAKVVNGVTESYVFDVNPEENLQYKDAVLEYTDGVLSRRWLHTEKVDEPIAFYEFSGSTNGAVAFDMFADRMGSISSVVNSSSGFEVASYTYSGYGTRSDSIGGVVQRYGFSGREHDTESALLFYRGRYFDPIAGTFIQSDPLGFEAGDLNVYAYVGNDPLNWVDPTGYIRSGTGTTSFGLLGRQAQANAAITARALSGVANLASRITASLSKALKVGKLQRPRPGQKIHGNDRRSSKEQFVYYIVNAAGKIQKIGLASDTSKRYTKACMLRNSLTLIPVQRFVGGKFGNRVRGLAAEKAHIALYRAFNWWGGFDEPPMQTKAKGFPC